LFGLGDRFAQYTWSQPRPNLTGVPFPFW
jgi:hypothetical protein